VSLDRNQNCAGALEGVRVLDLSRVLAGPLCTMILGDLGADVLKVERPGSGDETRQWGPPWAVAEGGRESAYFLAVNRNKRSITADLETSEGRERVRELMLKADVVVENFLSGKLERWGLGFDAISAANPAVVFCSIAGYPHSQTRPGYDFAVQADSGWMSITGEPEGEPIKVGVAVVDVLTGQNAALSILAALHERARSGRGQRVEVTLFHSALAGLVNVLQSALVGAEPRRLGNAHPNIVPYQAFRAADRQIVIAVGNDAQWRRLCAVLEAPGLADHPAYASNPQRVERRDELIRLLQDRVGRRPAAEWLVRFAQAGIPCAPVRSIPEALEDARASDAIWAMPVSTAGPVETLASPLGLRRTPPRLRRPAPALGEHDGERIWPSPDG
jgi:crotonobetainyl-CoA:carnitine CoA-transferase CaiB-like acyl-CoA transferase